MTDDLFLQLLLRQSAQRLRELRGEAVATVERGQRDVRYIDMALEIKEGSGGTAQAAARTDARPKKTAKPGSTREPIMQIVETDPDRVWLPSEVRDTLRDRYGIDAPSNTVRATMKRLLDEGKFARPYEGGHGFKLASTNGSGPEPPTEATSSAAGGFGRQDALAPQ